MTAKKVSVLLVEDDKLAQKMAVILLNQLNCEIKAASTSQLALELVQANAFDLIFADIGLPDADGLTLIEEIRNTPSANQAVPIIMLSAHSDKETISQSLQAGANDFFVKPLNKEIGKSILRKYLNV